MLPNLDNSVGYFGAVTVLKERIRVDYNPTVLKRIDKIQTKNSYSRMLELYCINYTVHGTNFIHLVPQAQKIAEHRRKYERKREEKEIKERMERVKKAREEHERAQRVGA